MSEAKKPQTEEEKRNNRFSFIVGIFIGLAISVINPSYISLLFTETAGLVMLGGAFLMECFGIFLIKRILAIEV